jgi:acetolactate synthase-1/2/3 large subunit
LTNKTNSIKKQKSSPEFRKQFADLLVEYLEQLSVDFVFGVPGGAIEPLYNALARSSRRGGPRPIVARHETGAAFMADGYARETGKLGVCCATTGPGATNLITGVSSAYENQIPMLVITAQTALSHFGKRALQESSCTGINTVGMFEHCTLYNTLISHPDQLEHKLTTAIMTAFNSPSGPVHLSIPKDILEAPALAAFTGHNLATLLVPASLIDAKAVEKLNQFILCARKVVFMIGSGCSEAISTLIEVAEALDAIIVAAPNGKGLIDPYHPLFRGIIGFAGHSSAREALTDPEVDLIVAVGTNLGEWASNGWDQDALLNSRLAHVDSNEEHLTHSPMARLHVRGRIRTVFETLLGQVRKSDRSGSDPIADMGSSPPKLPFQLDETPKLHSDATPIKPQRLMHELAARFPADTRFVADAGNSQAWAIHYLHPPGRRFGTAGKCNNDETQVFQSCSDFVSMGWAIGASIGIALGCSGKPVVCITGDGSLLMSGQEITVAVQEKLPVIFVVLNDAALGMVKHGQRLAKAEPIGFELPEIDYSAYATAMGAAGFVVRSPQDLAELNIESICRRPGPTLLDIRIDPEEVPPIGTRLRVLGTLK